MQGLGFEVLAQVLESISPSHVMQLTTFNPNNNLPLDMWWLPEGLPTQYSPLVYQLPSVGATQETIGVDPSGTSLQLATLSPSYKQQTATIGFPCTEQRTLALHATLHVASSDQLSLNLSTNSACYCVVPRRLVSNLACTLLASCLLYRQEHVLCPLHHNYISVRISQLGPLGRLFAACHICCRPHTSLQKLFCL